MIFGTFIRLGILLGSPAIGLTIYIVCQMILASIVISYCIEKISDMDGERHQRIKWCVILFFTICPVIPYYVCNMLKNSLHTILCVAYVFMFLMISLTDYCMNSREKACWIALTILLTLTQNTGVYFVVLTRIFIAVKSRANRKVIVSGMIASAFIMVILLPKIIYPAFNIFPGGKQEMLGTLFQQTARFVRDYEADVTESDIEIISRVLDYEVLRNEYTFETTDVIKATYNLYATREGISDYIRLWARWGLKHPDSYFRAILPICGQFFAMGYGIGIFDHIPSGEGIFAQIQHLRPEEEYNALSEIYYWLRSFPGIDILFQNALYVLWLPVYCIYCAVVRRQKSFVFIIPFVVNMLFLIVSPMAYSRYALPLIFTSPILVYFYCIKT